MALRSVLFSSWPKTALSLWFGIWPSSLYSKSSGCIPIPGTTFLSQDSDKMSGGEVLGAVALIPMLMDAFQKVVVFSLECEDFEHQVVRAKGSLSKERSKFFQSIHTLLQDTVDESILAEFENAADRQGAWDARGELAAAVEQTTTLNPKNGVPLRDAFTELCRLFKEWEKEMQVGLPLLGLCPQGLKPVKLTKAHDRKYPWSPNQIQHGGLRG